LEFHSTAFTAAFLLGTETPMLFFGGRLFNNPKNHNIRAIFSRIRSLRLAPSKVSDFVVKNLLNPAL
jgi:hypothetical protein